MSSGTVKAIATEVKGSGQVTSFPELQLGRLETLPPHMDLLWRCITATDEMAARAALQRTIAASPIDWPACARMSIRHGLASIAAYHLRSFAADPRVPVEVAACFTRMYLANGARNQALLRECGRLLRGFHEAGIRCLVLKGIGLALTVYPNPALRNCADIDLLVHPEDLDRAGDIAQALGFAAAHAEPDDCLLHRTFVATAAEDILTETLPLEYEEESLRAKLEPHRYRIVVEIHQGLFRDAAGMIRQTDVPPLWYAPRQVCLSDGTPMRMPSYEVMLVHLSAHAADHGFARLIYFHDLAAIIRQGEARIDWDLTVALAIRYEVCGYVYRCLEFVSRECGVAVSERVLTALRRNAGRQAHPLQPSDIFAAEREVGTGITLQRLLLAPDLRQFVGALRRILFPPPVIMRRLYHIRHPLLIALFYGLRPILLTGHLVRLLLRHIRR